MRLLPALLLCACTGETVTTHLTPVGDAEPAGFLSLPLAEPDRYYQTVGVDHDPEDHGGGVAGNARCTDYDGRGFPWCYDGHDGSDYLLEDGWDSLDAGSTGVVAAADGEVIEVVDGNYDRCHFSIELGDIDCDGHEMRANFVLLDHGNGVHTGYFHLKNGSTAVAVGDEVRCGDLLGLVGSSGYSSFPHLHFAVQQRGVDVDPYEGSNNDLDSLWIEQNANTLLPTAGCP
ncbi:MAG: M23 family metallopeptidase [Alphaproteobacteria bacterium]|nr:M23 family metallopeptidase [Alphaproteobacteria bacterium]